MARRPPSPVQPVAIFQHTVEDISNGLMRGLFSREELDSKYGKGMWHCLPRFAIMQNGKWRLIDDGLAASDNASFESSETIHTTSTNAGVAVLRFIRKTIGRPPFGLTGSVLHFNRVPAHAIAVARRWLAIPVQGFLEDFKIIDTKASKGSADRWFDTLMKFHQWNCDPAKRSPPSVVPVTWAILRMG